MTKLSRLLSCYILLLLCLLSGCERKAAFNSTDITGQTQIGATFHLPDSQGRMRQLAEFRGKVVWLFFGYAHCPDICPTTLATMRQVQQQLGPDADKLQVILVSLDPERDTPTLLTQYVHSFHPSFIALRPRDIAELKKIATDFKIYTEQKTPDAQGKSYTIDHSSGSYVFDTQGRIRLFVRQGLEVALLVQDIKLLLDEAK
jgi:protein SCO1/2